MATQVPKSAGKAPVKSIASARTSKRTRRKATDPSTGLMFKSAVKKCLKESVQDGSITVTRNTLAVLCGIANSLAEDAASTAALIAQKVNKKTIGGDEVIDAFNLILTGELKKLCVREIRNMMSKSNTQKPPK